MRTSASVRSEAIGQTIIYKIIVETAVKRRACMRRTDVDGVELGEDDGIDETRLLLLAHIGQCAIELAHLIDSIGTNEGLTDEEDEVRLVDRDQLRECAHEWLIVLHATGSIDQNDVHAVATRLANRILRDVRSIAIVPARVQWHFLERRLSAQALRVRAELLDGTSTERIACSDTNGEILRKEVFRSLGERRRFSCRHNKNRSWNEK